MLNKIKEAFNNNDIIVIREKFNDVPGWDRFISLIDYVSSDRYVSTNTRQSPIGLNKDLYLRVADAIDAASGKSMDNSIPELDPVLEYLNKELGIEASYAECYVNLTSSAEFKAPHNDPWTAVAWGCVGTMEWRIYKNFDSVEYKTYIINPGDLIIIPIGVIHSVIPTTPRASISFAYNTEPPWSGYNGK